MGNSGAMAWETGSMDPHLWSPEVSPNYGHVFEFERTFNRTVTLNTMKVYWQPVSDVAAVLYLAFIYWGPQLMAKRPKYDLRAALALWSTCLAVFSACGAYRCVTELMHIVAHGGFYESICNSRYIREDNITGYWTTLFVMSKLLELVDTFFIILRKQKLIFLHWFHHLTVLIYGMHVFYDFDACQRWNVSINYSVHTIMYAYYALRAMRFRIPRQVSMVITVLQLSQMVVCGYIIIQAIMIKEAGVPCQVNTNNLILGLVLYISYGLLFAHFFYLSYISNGGKMSSTAAVQGPDSKVNGSEPSAQIKDSLDNGHSSNGNGVASSGTVRKRI